MADAKRILRVDFKRIGRTHTFEPLFLSADLDPKEMRERIARFAQRYLTSNYFDVHVDLPVDPEHPGWVYIENGRYGDGTVTLEPFKADA